MAEKEIKAIVKLQLPATKATAGPPVGSTLGPQGINIGGFVKEFNEKTAGQDGMIIPCVVTVYKDRSFDFVLKTPPVANLIKKELGIESGSAKPKTTKVGNLTIEQVRKIAELKMQDLNASCIETAMSMVKGTARSMGITVQD